MNPQEYLSKIKALMKHNQPHIEAKIAINITDVLEAMERDSAIMAEVFAELKFWFEEGAETRGIPPILYRHIIRYVERGITMCQ